MLLTVSPRAVLLCLSVPGILVAAFPAQDSSVTSVPPAPTTPAINLRSSLGSLDRRGVINKVLGDKDKNDKNDNDKTTKTHETTSTSKTSSPSTSGQATGAAAAATKGTSTDRAGASSTKAQSSAASSASSCPSPNATQKKNPPRTYSVMLKPKSHKTHVQWFKKLIKDPKYKCRNEFMIEDKDTKEPQYYMAYMETVVYNEVKKRKSEVVKIVEEDPNFSPLPREGKVETNVTLTSLLKQHNSRVANKKRETRLEQLVRRIRSATIATFSWALMSLSMDEHDSFVLPMPNPTFTYPESGGANTDIYIVDTGMAYPPHPELAGRVVGYLAGDWIPHEQDISGSDQMLHGTRAGVLAAGSELGVAKRANIISVKAYHPNMYHEGSHNMWLAYGNTALHGLAMYTAIRDARIAYINGGRRPSVLSMSLSFPANHPIGTLEVRRTVAAGMSFFYAATNHRKNACESVGSSTRVPVPKDGTYVNVDGWMIIASYNPSNFLASDSDYGPCIDAAGPGANVLVPQDAVSWTAIQRSGTSYATPHLAGIASILLGENPRLTPKQIQDIMYSVGYVYPVLDRISNAWIRSPRLKRLFS